MLDTTQLYEEELRQCQASLAGIKWLSDYVNTSKFSCSECGSALIEQTDADETDQEDIALTCKACGEEQNTGKAIEHALEEALGGESYLRAKDEGIDGPIFTCPACGLETFVEHDDACAVCGAEPEGSAECARCSNQIDLDQRLYGDTSSLCSYCSHMMEKVMRE